MTLMGQGLKRLWQTRLKVTSWNIFLHLEPFVENRLLASSALWVPWGLSGNPIWDHTNASALDNLEQRSAVLCQL